jgi:predicted RNase H-like HicB family nuclease
MSKPKKTPGEYLKEPYSRVLIPDTETGTYTAKILEFPGCISQGDTPQEAYDRLEDTAIAWVSTTLDIGQEIPPPAIANGHSGKVALRLPKSLHRQAAIAAERDSSSLNQFIVSALSEKVGATNLYDSLVQRLNQLIVVTEKAAFNAITMIYKIEQRANTTETSAPFFLEGNPDVRNKSSNVFS